MKNNHKNHNTSFIWLLSVCLITVGLLFFCQFYFGDFITDQTKFYQNTSVNGVDVSGLTIDQAESLLEANLIHNKEKINLTLTDGKNEWKINGNDFEIVGNFRDTLSKTINYGRDGNVFQKKKFENQIKREGLAVTVPYQHLLGGVEKSIDNIVSQIEVSPVSSQVAFNPNSSDMFSVIEGENGYIVDRSVLEQRINSAIVNKSSEIIQIPLTEILPETSLNDYINSITLRSSFSTNYKKSSIQRKNNIKKALSAFNGMIVEPGKEVSFNNTTGPRTVENGYKNANIIFNGNYVSGVGGGVCQASTTLYNALLLADVEILQANHHTLPASYVPLSFDAMVSEGYSDLVFKNNLETPIYIKAYGTDTDAVVEIYGQPFEDGLEIKTRSELIKVVGHNGDDIIPDTSGQYSDKVLYKGEYYRLKYPQEGYESKGYIQYIKNGQLVEEKQIRHDRYSPQKGVIIEGCYDIEEGMVLPENSVKYISPQKVTSETFENAKKRWHTT